MATLNQVSSILPRIGRGEKEQLAWVLKVVEDEPKNFPLYVAAFAYLRRREALLLDDGGKVEIPSEHEGEQIYERWKTIILCSLERQIINMPRRLPEHLAWDKKGKHFFVSEQVDDDWLTRGIRPLLDLIHTHGHLIKKCLAPAKRGRPKQTCGRVFIADRPNQDHCSATCRSRAATRAQRARDRRRKALTR